MSWADAVGAVGGVIGAVGGTVGAISAYLAYSAAKAAANAEQRSADIAESSHRLDLERRHDDLAPVPPPALEAELVRHPAGHGSLFAEITVTRDYHVLVDATKGESTWRIHLPSVLWAGRHRFEIEAWPKDRTKPRAEEVRFRFWPPMEGEAKTDWSCPCHRPSTIGERAAGHWEWRLPVAYHDVADTIG